MCRITSLDRDSSVDQSRFDACAAELPPLKIFHFSIGVGLHFPISVEIEDKSYFCLGNWEVW